MLQQWRWWMRSSSLVFLSAVLLFGQDRFAGSWKSDAAGGEGKFEMTVGSTPADSKVSFTLNGSDVKTTVKQVKSEGDHIEVAYEFELQGYKLTSIVSGTRRESKLKAKYRTVASGSNEQVDQGTITTE